MKDLFLADSPEIEKSAEIGTVYMSEDSTEWVQEIISMFLQQFPYLQEQPLSVSWRKKNPDKGYAVGYLNVLNGAVPVIIEDFNLAPMDVLFTDDGVAIPLHDSFIQELMADPTAFAGLREGKAKSNQDLFNSALQFSPVTEYGSNDYDGKTRPAVKVASVIDNLSFVHKDDAIKLISELKDGQIKEAYENNDTIDYFEKVAKKAKSHTKEAHLESYLRELDIDRQMVYEDSLGNKFVKQANSKVDKTWKTRIDAVEYHELDKVIANEQEVPEEEKIEKNASFETKLPDAGDVGKFFNENGPETDEIEIIGYEKVASQPKTAALEVRGEPNKVLMFDEAGNWEMTEKKANLRNNLEKIAGSEPKIGDFGVFVVGKQSTRPFEITGMQKAAGAGNFKITGETAFEKWAFYPIKPENDEIESHETEKNAFYVPGNGKFVKLADNNSQLSELQDFEAKIKIEGLNGFDKVAFYGTDRVDEITWSDEQNAYLFPPKSTFFSKKVEDGQIKTANVDIIRDHEVFRDDSGLFNLRGPEFAKYAQSNPVRNLDEDDAKWAALHCGATEKDLEKISSLRYNRSTKLNGKMQAPTPIDKVDKKLDEHLNGLNDGKLKIAKNLIKEASYFRDKRTVDAMLSLSLLRKRNVQEYLAVLPTYEMVLSELAKLLIASRMGLANTSPDAIKNAMEALTEVVLQLNRLQSSIKDVK